MILLLLLLLTFILVAYGASNIMAYSSIFEKWRNLFHKISPTFWGEFFTCMICLPFWWGVILCSVGFSPLLTILSIININVFGLFLIQAIYIKIFLSGCLASGSVWLLHTLQEKLEK